MDGMTSYSSLSNYANHVLVASPSNAVRQRVLDSLRSPARRFKQASGGAEALVDLESGFWQVLFLDRELPDLNAEELGDTVRRRYPGVEVVLLDPESAFEPRLGDSVSNSNWHTENSRPEPEALAATRAAQSVLESPLPGMIGNS